ncbi:unnamed protein product [Lactuca virosa]|uniref:F-box/LRR-repeat protein 15/At3g58940/PEG3-like LRR domain-containing protein n=1 Tax=Lactuca virosa TaxID=75947 RepID=A0AAU9PCA8_9ASTR|nr:unnamed protein product [Lactuca virosa]
MKFVVQTCLLSSRWKLLWTTMPYLNFSNYHFGSLLRKFSKFVTHVLSHRNNQVDVSLVKLRFEDAVSQVIVKRIANYAFSHNVQELTIESFSPYQSYYPRKYPSCLFISRSLKHFTFSSPFSPCVTPKTPWDFPALTTLHLLHIKLCDALTQESLDLFSKCVNLKNLTLDIFTVEDVGVLDIITPRLSTLTLIYGRCSEFVNLVAPQLEKLKVINCSFKYLNAPPGLSLLYYRGHCPPAELCKDRFHSLNKVTICLYLESPYKEEDARKSINMLQKLHSARYLTLNADIIECISSFPDLLLHHSSPFSNLICLKIDSGVRKDVCQVNMSTEARNFFLDNSPNATIIMELTTNFGDSF